MEGVVPGEFVLEDEEGDVPRVDEGVGDVAQGDGVEVGVGGNQIDEVLGCFVFAGEGVAGYLDLGVEEELE